jgi:hypothetical protein
MFSSPLVPVEADWHGPSDGHDVGEQGRVRPRGQVDRLARGVLASAKGPAHQDLRAVQAG